MEKLALSPAIQTNLMFNKAKIALILENIINRRADTDFWQQCVRDTTGKWEAYKHLKSKSGFNYFRGRQAHVDYNNPLEMKYLEANLRVRSKFYAELPEVLEMDISEFRQWIESLHEAMRYQYTYTGIFPRFTDTHTPIVKLEVIPLAEEYNDPYFTLETQGPNFLELPRGAQPRDVLVGEIIYHHYPGLEYAEEYLNVILKSLKEILGFRLTRGQYVRKVAHIYQLLTNLHLFVNINSSLYMNITNGLLEIAGIKGIEHGILDFVGMRLQPENFQAYFFDELKEAN